MTNSDKYLVFGDGFTIFSKSGCTNCRRVKDYLKENGITPLIIDCDEALLEDREKFLQYLRDVGAKGTAFPFVFHANTFLGNYEDTKRYVEIKQQQEDAFNDVY